MSILWPFLNCFKFDKKGLFKHGREIVTERRKNILLI